MAASSNVSLGSVFRKVYTTLKLDGSDISTIYIFAILGGLVQLSLPIGIQSIINFVQAGSMSTSIIVLIFMVVLGTFINGLLQVRQMQYIEKIQQKIFLRYSFTIVDRIPKLNIQKLDNYYLPELVNRFFDTMTFQKSVAKLLLDIPAASIQIIFGLILLSLYHPVFIVFGIVLALLLILILRFTADEGFATSMQASDYKYKNAAWIEELARAVKTFKFAKETDLHLLENDKISKGYIGARTAHFKVLQSQYWSLITFKVTITAAMLIVGAILLVGQQLNIGQFIAAEIVIITVIGSVEKFITSLDVVYDCLTASTKLAKIVEAEVEKSGTLTVPENGDGLRVEFKDVVFSYHNDKTVLNKTSFVVPSNSCMAVVGKSGSGKSTILQLLTGAFAEKSGSVLVNNVPIANYDVTSLRHSIGLLLNSQDIFQGTLLQNITMGHKHITTDSITELAEKLGFLDIIQKAPQGLDTILDPAGKRMSKRDVKRVLLLRALIGKHRLLLLEDPFGDMEPQNVIRLQQYFTSLKQTTVLFTTSSNDVAEAYPHVIELEEGYVKRIK